MNSPVSAAPRQHLRARLLSKREVAPYHFQFELLCPTIAHSARPGQFVHVLPSACAFEDGFDPLLRRAFSIMKVEGENFTVLFRALGKGTILLSKREEGEDVDMLGPLGNVFDLQMFHVKHATKAILVGGGVGVPPMVFLGSELQRLGITPTMILGARSKTDIIAEAEFSAQGTPVLLRTEDGSYGNRGRVTDDLELLLKNSEGEMPTVFACGPYPMLRAVSLMCEKYGASVQVSLEENMPCGIGVCNGCVVPINQSSEGPEDTYGKFRRMCVEGPVCRGEEVEWK